MCKPNWKAHLFFGLIAALLIDTHTPPQFFLCLFGSLLPDVDHPKSFLGRFNPLAWFGLHNHRGHTHSFIGIALLSLIGIGSHAYWAMFVGCASHLIIDGEFKLW